MASQCPIQGRKSGETYNGTSGVTSGGAGYGEELDDDETRIPWQSEVGKTFVDCGAEESVGGTKALELFGKLIGPEQILIDRQDRPWFICEDGSLKKVEAKVTFHTPAWRLAGRGGFYVLEAEALESLGATIDFAPTG